MQQGSFFVCISFKQGCFISHSYLLFNRSLEFLNLALNALQRALSRDIRLTCEINTREMKQTTFQELHFAKPASPQLNNRSSQYSHAKTRLSTRLTLYHLVVDRDLS